MSSNFYDKETDKFLRNYLKEKFPSYSFLTEESIDNKFIRKSPEAYFIGIVDNTHYQLLDNCICLM